MDFGIYLKKINFYFLIYENITMIWIFEFLAGQLHTTKQEFKFKVWDQWIIPALPWVEWGSLGSFFSSFPFSVLFWTCKNEREKVLENFSFFFFSLFFLFFSFLFLLFAGPTSIGLLALGLIPFLTGLLTESGLLRYSAS